MSKSFRGYLLLRIAAFISLLAALSVGFYLYRASAIESSLRAERAGTLSKLLAQQIEKKRDVGITNAISMASGGNLAGLVEGGDRGGAESELKRIGAVFTARSNFRDINIHLFDRDFRTFLRNWMPDRFGDTDEQTAPLLRQMKAEGKARADFVVDQSGLFLRGTAPLNLDGRTVGYLQFLQGVGSVSRDFEKEGKGYGLLITREAASASPPLAGEPTYGGLVLAEKTWFSPKIRETLKSLDIQALIKAGDLLSDGLFAVSVPLTDFRGTVIGYHVLAEPRSILDGRIEGALSTARVFIIFMVLGFIFMGGFISFMLNRALLKPMGEVAEFAEAVGGGDRDRAIKGTPKFELAILAATIVDMIASLRQRTQVAREQAEEARSKKEEAGKALERANANEEHINSLLQAMQGASGKAERISRQVLESVNDLSAEVDQVARGVRVQSERMAETATAMEEMNASVAEVARNASHAAANAENSREKATTGANGVRNAVASINRIGVRVNDLKETMIQLGEQASSIGQVLNVITDIADQTNLLALNAAIEAARAGEAGRGFAVVADEVRKLAEKTMDATKEVAGAIGSIQEAAEENVKAVVAAAEDINESTEAADEAGRFMEEIVSIVDETSGQVASIATAAEEQSATSEEINRAVTEVNRIASDSTEGMARSADNLGSITALISDLNETVQSMTSAEDAGSLDKGDDLISWSNKLALGIDSIDTQHKQLVKLINDLNKAMRDKESAAVMRDIVAGLKEYVLTHFAYEEELFDKHGYPETEDHKGIHSQFVEKVGDFELALTEGKATVSIEVMRFLRDWLVQHIMGTDREYVPFLTRHGVR